MNKKGEYGGLTNKDIVIAKATGIVFTCPICGHIYEVLHRETGDGKLLKHDFEHMYHLEEKK